MKTPDTLLYSFFMLLCCCGAIRAQEKRPNIVIILSDDQGWADIGYNNPKAYTPNLDKLASTGATFTNHYVMPQCTPTRVALLTGRYPSRFGGDALQASNNPAFPIGTPTISQMMHDAGYETFLCGKWHLGSTLEHGPTKFGFDHSYGSLTGAIGMYDHRYREGEFCETWHRDDHLIPGSENGEHATDLVTREAIKIINADREKPFFLYLPFHAIHTPLDERGKFVDQPTALDPENPERWRNEDEIEWFNDPDGIIQSEKDPDKRLLLATAHHLDDAIGKIVAALDQSGQRENTLILFSSDNGPQVNWGGDAYPNDLKLTDFNQPLPMRGKKVDVWEGGIHVPGFANWPGRIERKKIDDTIHIVDWFPTLAKLIGHTPATETKLDGVDLTPVIFDNGELAARDHYWVWNLKMNRWALRHGDWKVVKYGVGVPNLEDWELYNLETDSKEQINVAADNPAILQQLHARFLAHRQRDAQLASPSVQKAGAQ